MKKILVVEDDDAYLNLLNEQLTKHGYQVLTAKEGETGLAIAKVQHPDLLIVDIKMPVMDGLTMLHELRQDAYGKNANVILLTNMEANGQIAEKVIEDQPTHYIVKSDIRFDELLTKIDDILSA